MKIVLSIILFFCFEVTLKSQTNESINCDSAITQYEMNICAKLAFTKADKELNNIYNNILSSFQKSTAENIDTLNFEYYRKIERSFIEAQKKWLEYRDAYCKVFELKYEGGSLMQLVYYDTMTILTESRIKELKIFLDELNN